MIQRAKRGFSMDTTFESVSYDSYCCQKCPYGYIGPTGPTITIMPFKTI